MRLLLIIGLMLACLSPYVGQAAVPESAAQIRLSFAPVAKQAAPAVVNIYTKRRVVERASPFAGDPFFQHFFGRRFGAGGMTRERVVSSLGSGVMIDTKGMIVTNDHVIKDADDITVVLNDRREYDAEILLRDEQTDLALLKLNNPPTDLPVLRLRDSDELEVGDLVLAIGNPFGVGQTVTSGIVSATARAAKGVNDFGFFIQTDAAINPGNSGGALVDLQGRLVGVPSAIYTRSGGSNGIGFAIPANMVRAMLASDMKDGRVLKPWLGAKYQNITREFAQSLGLNRSAGVLVNDVIEGSPADDAGLQAGDVIVALNEKTVDDAQALHFRIVTEPVGKRLPLDIIRDGKERSLRVRLQLPPDRPARDERSLSGNHPLNGVRVANLNPALAIELGIDPSLTGVVLLSAGRNMKAGDVLLRINGQKVASTRALQEMLRQSNSRSWKLEMQRGNQSFTMRFVR